MMATETKSPGDTSQTRRTHAALVASVCPTTASRSHRRNQSPGRRQFIALLAMAPFAGALVAMLQRMRARNQPVPVSIPPDVPVGLSIASEVIVNRHSDGAVRAFAARCTHLGCRLERVVDGVIVCPCHGSRFHSDGRVAAGPAARPLAELRVNPDAQTGGWTVDVG